jgi:L-cysteate sulfo-lyase
VSSLLAPFPRLTLAALPTPLQTCHRLSEHLGGPRILVKRDDLTGAAGGGNKIRKLEFVVADALDRGADTLVTMGVGQSNSARQVAGVGASLGMDVHVAVITDRVARTDPAYLFGGNALLTRLFGATLHECSVRDDRHEVVGRIANELEAEGKHPIVVPYGVSSARGGLGYVAAAHEIADQIDEPPTAIVHGSGTGATQAGLIVGAAQAMPGTDVIGVDVDAEPERVAHDVAALVFEITRLLDTEPPLRSPEVLAGCAGAAYGSAPEEVLDAIDLFARYAGLVLDPVYSGVGAAGLIEMIAAGRFSREETVVYLHTGGTPGLHAYQPTLTSRS